MNSILSIFICFSLLLCSSLQAKTTDKGYSSDICTGCEQDFQGDIYTYINYKMKQIHQILVNYELEGSNHKISFDYHVGYLSGQYEAYTDILKILSRD